MRVCLGKKQKRDCQFLSLKAAKRLSVGRKLGKNVEKKRMLKLDAEQTSVKKSCSPSFQEIQFSIFYNMTMTSDIHKKTLFGCCVSAEGQSER